MDPSREDREYSWITEEMTVAGRTKGVSELSEGVGAVPA